MDSTIMYTSIPPVLNEITLHGPFYYKIRHNSANRIY